MYLYLASILVLLGSLWYIYLVYKPKKRFLWYKKVYEALGYKVKMMDFHPLSLGLIVYFKKWQRMYGDAQYMLKMQQFTQFDILLINTFKKTEVFLLNPQLTKNFLSQPSNIYKFKKYPLGTSNIRRLLGDGIIFSQGNTWKRKRKVITKLFTHQLLVSNIPRIAQIFDQLIEAAQKLYEKQHPGNQNLYDMQINTILMEIFSTVMLRIFFGHSSNEVKLRNKNIGEFTVDLIADIIDQGMSITMLLFGTWLFKKGITKRAKDINNRLCALKVIVKIFVNEKLNKLKTQEPNQKYGDIIGALHKYQSKNPSNSEQQKYDFEEIISEFLTFLHAGTDTTSHFNQAMIYYISINEHVEQKLRQEIEKYIKNNEDYTWENLKKLQYIDWIQKETTRYFGPANFYFYRLALQDTFVGNLPVKEGDIVSYLSMPSHFSPKYFNKPHEFRPQRWKSECKGIPPLALLGFSSGPRSCIGKKLALLENKIALIKFMKRYKLISLPKKKINVCFKFIFKAEAMSIKLQKKQ